jgi:hypothetical protein
VDQHIPELFLLQIRLTLCGKILPRPTTRVDINAIYCTN